VSSSSHRAELATTENGSRKPLCDARPGDDVRLGATDEPGWRLIFQAIEIRAAWASFVIAVAVGKPYGDSWALHHAIALARDAGADHPHQDCPALIRDVDLLVRAFEEAQARTREDAIIEAFLGELGLPAPDALLAELLENGSASVDHTLLIWDREEEVTWYTNAYGIDGALCGTPDRNALRTFLIETARGIEYGPVPH